MIVNPDVDGYNKILNHREILRKTQKNNNLLKTTRILKPKYKLSGGQVFTFSLFGGWRFASSSITLLVDISVNVWRFSQRVV